MLHSLESRDGKCLLLPIPIFRVGKNETLILCSHDTKQVYNIACVHPNLIPIGVIMVHFSTYARPCVHPMTCASQMGEACMRMLRDNTIKNV